MDRLAAFEERGLTESSATAAAEAAKPKTPSKSPVKSKGSGIEGVAAYGAEVGGAMAVGGDKIINALAEFVAKAKRGETNAMSEGGTNGAPETVRSSKFTSWKNMLEKPALDYSKLFHSDIGQEPYVFFHAASEQSSNCSR